MALTQWRGGLERLRPAAREVIAAGGRRYYIPVTARDVSTGHDPGITKALTLLNTPD